jgi:hypothetical protein
MSSSSPVLSAGIYDFSNDPSSLGSAFEFEIRLDARSEGNTKSDKSQLENHQVSKGKETHSQGQEHCT